jgi:hypothetical protein
MKGGSVHPSWHLSILALALPPQKLLLFSSAAPPLDPPPSSTPNVPLGGLLPAAFGEPHSYAHIRPGWITPL